jgi:hypothetical protein
MNVEVALATAQSAKRNAELIVASMDEIIRHLNSQTCTGEGAQPKRDDGRLSEAGIDALYADFAAGQLSNEQIRQKHDISKSGLTKRKAMWRDGKR